jgi:asparagine synthetase B (glutamine-hydrolysing)
MCGIFGLVIRKGDKYEGKFIADSIIKLAHLSESRGKDSSGLAFRNMESKSFSVYKGPVSVSGLLKSREVKQEFNKIKGAGTSKQHISVFGHARLVTNGSQLNDENNQPVIKDGIIGIHNGIIVNVDEIWNNHADISRKYDIDTEVMLSLIRKSDNELNDLKAATMKSMGEIFGTVATALFTTYKEKLLLTTNNGSLYILSNFKDILFFASEKYFLLKLLHYIKPKITVNDLIIKQVKPMTGYVVDLAEFSIEHFDANGLKTIPSNDLTIDEYNIEVKSIGKDIENKAVIIDPSSFMINHNAVAEQNMLEYNIESVMAMQRCTKCLLPDSFPFIHFDEEGVCNYCNNYVPKSRPRSINELRNLVEPFRKKNGDPDCIVPFSGGRDSTFSLHMVKNELKMNPIAFTYDWGMVTDLARRNIARVCGNLEVENIIVAANIRWKRQNIRKNIMAWLKNPELGMVPLFMAGDKFFFYYTNKLKKQTGITLNIWGVNYLENTDFKTGFAGIPPNFEKKRIYSLSLKNKIRLFSYVGRNLINTPSYLNQSVIDTLGSFAARYIAPKKDYFHFFDYYPWDEKEIENIILSEYDWETAADMNSTWRIGDGTASFYNYLYYTVAGFSEIDTFRSNQLREGMINREDALKMSLEENRPRYESIKWYLEILGLDFESVIKQINNIPKLYKTN